MNNMIGKVSQKGQIVIPVAIRKMLGLEKGSKVTFEVRGNSVEIKKVPTSLDWAELLKEIPEEKVEFDKNGHYDPKKSPDFHDWMGNG